MSVGGEDGPCIATGTEAGRTGRAPPARCMLLTGDAAAARGWGGRALQRPDLFLAENVLNRYLLIEFKRPSHSIDRDDENQAEKYRDEVDPLIGTMDIIVIGGKKSPIIQTQYQKLDIRLLTYEAVLSRARTRT